MIPRRSLLSSVKSVRTKREGVRDPLVMRCAGDHPIMRGEHAFSAKGMNECHFFKVGPVFLALVCVREGEGLWGVGGWLVLCHVTVSS